MPMMIWHLADAHLFWSEKSGHLVGCGDSVDVEKVQGGRGRCGRRLLQMIKMMIDELTMKMMVNELTMQ